MEIHRTEICRVDQAAGLLGGWLQQVGPFEGSADPFHISFACIMTRALSCLV